jgi:hypothetical protein
MSSGERRSSALAAASDAPTFLLSTHGLVLSRGAGPPNLPEMAFLAVGLAERIGAHLAVAAFSVMEIRLDRRQFVVARRADGNIEAVELARIQRPTDSLETKRPQTGEVSADEVLAGIRNVPGVESSFIVSATGELLAGGLSPPLDDVAIAPLIPRLIRLCEVFPHSDGQLLCTLHYGGHLLFLRALHSGLLCVLASSRVSQSAARSAIGVVARQWSLLAASSITAEPRQAMSLPPVRQILDVHAKRLAGAAVVVVALMAASATIGHLVFKPRPPRLSPPPSLRAPEQRNEPLPVRQQPGPSMEVVLTAPPSVEPPPAAPAVSAPPAPTKRPTFRANRRHAPPRSPRVPPARVDVAAPRPPSEPPARRIDATNPYLPDVP